MVGNIKIDVSDFVNVHLAMVDISTELENKIIYLTLNRTGDMVYTQIKRLLSKETAIRPGLVAEKMDKKVAHPGKLKYEIIGRAGFTKITKALFGAADIGEGVAHRAWGREQIAVGAFMIGDRAVRREAGRILSLWGPSIPREMARGESQETAETTVEKVMLPRLLHEIDRATRNAKGKYHL